VNNWTPARPTKPGKYWLSVAIPDRERFACAICREIQHVYTIEIVEEGCGLWLDGVIEVGYCLPESAKFLPYVEPPDPFAEPVPSLRERVEALPTYGYHGGLDEIARRRGGDYLKRSEVLALFEVPQ
jgi:hypothetical protein